MPIQRLLTCLALLLVAHPTAAQDTPARQPQPAAIQPAAAAVDAVVGLLSSDLSPAAAARAMTLPPGFRVELCAGEPDVRQPIAMAFDDRGRLWVAEAYSYPKRVPDDEARDRILIFEDTDGDSHFDRRKVFAEKLNLVSGLAVGFGGVWVGAAPNFLFIPDADGDDVPDEAPRILLDGWGYQDTHETLNSFIWGPDGWLYGCHGVFTHSAVGKPGTPDEQRTKINAGVWRYHPTRHTFEVFAEGTSNPWGIDFNARGHAFITACVIPHLYHIIQGARYQRQAGRHFNPFTFDDIKTIAKHRHWRGNQWNPGDREKSNDIGGGHAHAGAMLYQGGAWPERYRDQLFMNNILGSRLNQDRLTPQGSGYSGDAAPDFCFTNDSWSQILYLTYGPDGQTTMIDWYDANQCHRREPEVHDPRNGRIYKIIYGDAKPVTVDLAKQSDRELAELQFASNEWFVRHARRLLQERAAAGKSTPDVAPYLVQQLQERTTTGERLRALWALHAIDALDDARRIALLADRDADVRAWTIQLAAERSVSGELLARFEQLAAADPSPVVRSYLASALTRLPTAERENIGRALLAHADDADDHNLPLQYWYGVEPLAADPARAVSLLQSCRIPLVSRFLVRRLASDDAGYEPLLAELGERSEADRLWMLEEIVAALKVRSKLKMPATWEATYPKLAKSQNQAIVRQAEYVGVKFGDERVLPSLRRTLNDPTADVATRGLAIEALLEARDRELPAALQRLLGEKSLRAAAINGLAAYDDPGTPVALLAKYGEFDPAEKQAALATLTSRPAYVLALLDEIEAKRIPRGDLSAFTVRQLAMLKDQRVIRRLNEVWGATRATSADKAVELARLKEKLKPEVLGQADPAAGRRLFDKTCASCHILFGNGKNIGPDLTGSNRANLDYLLENVLDPSAVIGKDYQTTLLVTTDGRTLTGIVRQETPTAVTLQTPTDIVTLAKSDIEERTLSELSLMPDGQLKTMQPQEIRDLVAYLGTSRQVRLPDDAPRSAASVPGALEGEGLKIVATSGGIARPQPWRTCSGAAQLWWTGAAPGDKLTLEVPVEKAGRYEIFAVCSKAVDYGIVRFGWNDAAPRPPLDLFHRPDVIQTEPISLGVHTLPAGPQRLTIEIVGANESAKKSYMLGLDYVRLQPVGEKP